MYDKKKSKLKFTCVVISMKGKDGFTYSKRTWLISFNLLC
jgi:hypothetical protein